MKRLTAFVAAFAIIAIGSFAQTSVSPVQELAPGIISTGQGFTVTFSPDGHDVYFTARDMTVANSAADDNQKSNAEKPRPQMHVYRSHFDQGAWQPARPVAFSSQQWSDLDPFITVDGKRMFFVSTRTTPSKEAGKREMDIWYSEFQNGDWAEPHWIAEINSPGKEGSPSLDRHDNLYFFSDRERAQQNLIYISRWHDGHLSAPRKLSVEINAGPSDTSPWIAPNGKTLLFYSTRAGGYGKADLYVSYSKHGNWSKAINLGPTVNTDDFEYNPSVSRDGRTLYFGRGGKIYSVPLDALHIPGLNRRRFR
jgi:Tol biopolymer transport system component